MSQYALNRKTSHKHAGNRKIARVKWKRTKEDIELALSEGFELSTDWEYSPLLTVKAAVRYYNELKGGFDAEWTSNNETRPLI